MIIKDLELLWVAAFRYCLGRRTYVVSEFVESAIRNWGGIPESAQKLITKELRDAVAKDSEMRADEVCSIVYYPLGQDCDRADWVRLLEFVDGGVYEG